MRYGRKNDEQVSALSEVIDDPENAAFPASLSSSPSLPLVLPALSSFAATSLPSSLCVGHRSSHRVCRQHAISPISLPSRGSLLLRVDREHRKRVDASERGESVQPANGDDSPEDDSGGLGSTRRNETIARWFEASCAAFPESACWHVARASASSFTRRRFRL